MKILAFHATTGHFDRLDPTATADRGVHFGSKIQAQMRGGPRARVIAAELDVQNPRRARDDGSGWAAKVKAAKAQGHDAIVYLNRYEGLSLAHIEDAIKEGVDLDRLSDAQFRRRIPDAEDAWIVFYADQIRVCPDLSTQPASPVSRPRP